MIDWHCHILPGMDDGSHSAAESLSLLNMQVAQGIDTVIATPHFYADDETVSSFLERRMKSLDILKAELTETAPRIVPGAEVKYYPGISRLPDLKFLRIEKSKLILLEMPMLTWSESTINELMEMGGNTGTKVVLAHFERYYGFQKAEVWNRVFERGILIQSNAGFFISFRTKHKSLKLLKEGRIHFLGSDCHSISSRPPQIGRAYEIIRKKHGEEFIEQLDRFGRSWIE